MNLFRVMLLFVTLMICHHQGYSQQRELQGTELNIALKTDLGEIMVLSKEVIKDIQVQITSSYEVKKRAFNYKYPEGVTYPLRRSKDGYNLYYAHDTRIDGKYGGVGINEDNPDDIIAVLVSPDGDLIKMKKYKMNDHIKMVEKYEVCRECQRKEFIYLGLDGNQLKFKFQHFSGVLNKILSEEELSFSYKKYEIIEYDGAQLKIIEASPKFISYEVLQSFK